MKPNKEGVTNSFVLQQNLGTHLHRKPSNYIFLAWKETFCVCVCVNQQRLELHHCYTGVWGVSSFGHRCDSLKIEVVISEDRRHDRSKKYLVKKQVSLKICPEKKRKRGSF